MDLNANAQFYLHHIKHNCDFDDGILFKKALTQLQFDYSLQSIQALDKLLKQVRKQHQRFLPEQFLQRVEAKHFLLLLAYYVGETIAFQLKMNIAWYSYQEARKVLPSDFELPEQLVYSIVGMVEGNVCFPLGILAEHLFNRQQPLSLKKYVEQNISRIRTDHSKSKQDWVNSFLYHFEEGIELAGGLAHNSLLQRAELDYSLESLEQVDTLLKLVRRDKQFTYDALHQETSKSNFVLFVAFYLLEVICRVADVQVEWVGFDAVKQRLGSRVTFCFETSHACFVQDYVYFPLALVTEVLFDPQPTRNCCEYVARIIADISTSEKG